MSALLTKGTERRRRRQLSRTMGTHRGVSVLVPGLSCADSPAAALQLGRSH